MKIHLCIDNLDQTGLALCLVVSDIHAIQSVLADLRLLLQVTLDEEGTAMVTLAFLDNRHLNLEA